MKDKTKTPKAPKAKKSPAEKKLAKREREIELLRVANESLRQRVAEMAATHEALVVIVDAIAEKAARRAADLIVGEIQGNCFR